MIDESDVERLKDIFVTQHECQNNLNNINKMLNQDNVRLAVIEQQNKIILWVLAAVGGGIITMLIKMFFGG